MSDLIDVSCPRHGERLRRTDWWPPVGLDPRNVQFKCPKCKYSVYDPQRTQDEIQEHISAKTRPRRDCKAVPDVPAG